MNFLKRIPLFEILLTLAVLGVSLYAALSDAYNLPNAMFSRDDAYYYFKVAQNISEGRGSTFDGINMTNGYHPLWMLVCIPIFAFARFDLILPLRILVMAIGALNAAAAVLIYRLVRDNLSTAAAMAAASFWAFDLYLQEVFYKLGLESPLAAFGVILTLYQFSRFEKEWRTTPVSPRRIAALALAAALAMFSRLDLAFFAFLGGLWIVLRGKPMRTLLPLDTLIVFFSMVVSAALRVGIVPYNSTYADAALLAAALAMVFKSLALYFFGAYRHPRALSFWNTVRSAALGATAGSLLSAAAFALLFQMGVVKGLPRSAFVIDWALSLVLFLALRAAMYWFGSRDIRPGVQLVSPLAELRINWRRWLSDSAAYYGVVGGLLALYMLYNKAAFGSYFPVSGQIKRWWGSLLNTVYEKPSPDWSAFLGVSYESSYQAWQPLTSFLVGLAKWIYPLYPGADTLDERYYIVLFAFIALALAVLFANPQRARKAASNMALIPLAAGCGFHVLSYTATAYGGTKEWYWVGEALLVVLGASLLVHLSLPFQKARLGRFFWQAAALAFSVGAAYRLGMAVSYTMPYNFFPSDLPYMEVLPYLEENTPPGSVIGMTGGGNVGYFIHDRTIVNMDGLINSYEYFRALRERRAAEYLIERGVDVVFANPRLLALPPYYGQFDPYFEIYSQYGGKNLIYLLKEPKYDP